nr:hypothetical protein [Tanacetum cinerariifolium]
MASCCSRASGCWPWAGSATTSCTCGAPARLRALSPAWRSSWVARWATSSTPFSTGSCTIMRPPARPRSGLHERLSHFQRGRLVHLHRCGADTAVAGYAGRDSAFGALAETALHAQSRHGFRGGATTAVWQAAAHGLPAAGRGRAQLLYHSLGAAAGSQGLYCLHGAHFGRRSGQSD